MLFWVKGRCKGYLQRLFLFYPGNFELSKLVPISPNIVLQAKEIAAQKMMMKTPDPPVFPQSNTPEITQAAAK